MHFKLLLPLFALLTACGEPTSEGEATDAADALDGIAVMDARLRLPVIADRPGVAYMTIDNGTETAVELTGVTVEGAERSELHETMREGDAMRMAAVEAIAIQPGGSVTLEQGGLHIMVFGLSPDDNASSRRLTLEFADGTSATADVPVERATGGAAN